MSREDTKISKALDSRTSLESLTVEENIYKKAVNNIERRISEVRNGTAQLALAS